MSKKEILYIVVPCYNEEEALPETSKRLNEKLAELKERELISERSRVVFVDDGSRDKTWESIEKLHSEFPKVFQTACMYSAISTSHQ